MPCLNTLGHVFRTVNEHLPTNRFRVPIEVDKKKRINVSYPKVRADILIDLLVCILFYAPNKFSSVSDFEHAHCSLNDGMFMKFLHNPHKDVALVF